MPRCFRESASRCARVLTAVACPPRISPSSCPQWDKARSNKRLLQRDTPENRSWSANRSKRRRPSPSKALEAALRQNELPWAVPRLRVNKLDLSYMNPSEQSIQRWRQERFREQEQIGRRAAQPNISLQSILATYTLRTTSNDISASEEYLNSVLISPEEARILFLKGYSEADLAVWHRILSTQDDIVASELLLAHRQPAHSEERQSPPPSAIPTFVVMFFLRRQRLSAAAFRNVLIYVWDKVVYQTEAVRSSDEACNASSTVSPTASLVMDDSTFFIMIIRLLRHARTVLPEAFITIIRLFLERWSLPDDWHLKSPNEQRRTAPRIVLQHNRLLHLLALPSASQPFASASFQQVAQFDLLHHMAQQRPTIPVSREGYQAISRVQLASPKTEQERDWARLKVNTWPPWKEDKIGFDSEKTPDYGVSRALAAIHHARQAGYGSSAWDKLASILAGWDTDRTPTIQTRAWLLHRSVNPRWRVSDDQYNASLWAVRVRATRTAHEAWALFLSYEGQGGKPDRKVYFEMLQKLAFEAKRLDQAASVQALTASEPATTRQGGDAKEVLPIPSSEREGVYTSSPLPNMDELAERMMQAGLSPTSAISKVLIENAHTYDLGIKYLEWSSELSPSALCLASTGKPDPDALRQIPPDIFNAFLTLFCRFANETNKAGHDRSSQSVPKDMPSHALRLLQLVRLRAPAQLAPWHTLLRALTTTTSSSQDIETWRVTVLVRRHMKELGLPIDVETFRLVCRGAENAAIAAALLAQKSEASGDFPKYAHTMQIEGMKSYASVDEFRSSVSSYIRKLFYELFGTQDARKSGRRPSKSGVAGSMDLTVPQLLIGPMGITLHSYVRVQGLLLNHHSLLEVVRWMAEHSELILRTALARPNGRQMLRRCLVSISVFCERSWAREGSSTPANAAPRSTVSKIKDIISSQDGWGGWPTGDEVEMYCEGKMPQRLRRLRID